jgi:hypothetical protein
MAEERKRPGWIFWTTVVVVAIPLLYLLSFGPACWWFSGDLDNVWQCVHAPKMYWPIGRAYRHANGDERWCRAIRWYATLRHHFVMVPDGPGSESGEVWMVLNHDENDAVEKEGEESRVNPGAPNPDGPSE